MERAGLETGREHLGRTGTFPGVPSGGIVADPWGLPGCGEKVGGGGGGDPTSVVPTGTYHFGRSAARGGIDPFVLGGFSLFGPTSRGGGRGSPGGNFGGGINLWLAKHAALRFEARDHAPGSGYIPGNQYLSYRVGVTFR